MPITALPTPPSRNDPANFATRADAFLAALPTFVSEANALEANAQASGTSATSTSSLTISTGSKSLTIQTGKTFPVGAYVHITSTATPSNYMAGSVTSYTSGTGAMVVNVEQVGGSGTLTAWTIGLSARPSSILGGVAGAVPYQTATNATGFSAAGTTGQVLISGGTGAPTWTSSPAVTTQAAGNNTTSAASTAFVRAAGLSRSGIPARTGAVTLTAADAGAMQYCASATPFTVTLPAASTVPAGYSFEFVNGGTAAVTVARAGTDIINGLSASGLTSVVLDSGGDCYTLVSNGSTGWVMAHTSARRTYESAWVATLPALSSATSFTHGLGVAPRFAWIVAECTTADGTFAVGDRVNVWTNNAAYGSPSQFTFNATALILTAQSGAWVAIPKTGGNAVGLTPASWRYKVFAEA